MMGWQRLQLRISSARPSPSGSCASVGVGKGDWPFAAPVMVDERKPAIRSSEEAKVERMNWRGPLAPGRGPWCHERGDSHDDAAQFSNMIYGARSDGGDRAFPRHRNRAMHSGAIERRAATD